MKARTTCQLVIAGVVLLGLASCGQEASPAKTGAGSDDSEKTVAVAKVVREDLSRSVELTAEFLPWQQVEVHAKVSGYVRQMNVDVGDHAKTGDLLAVLEVPEIDQELNQAKAAVMTAQQDAQGAQAEYDETTSIAGRLNRAAKETQGLIAQQDLDNADDNNRANAAKMAAANQRVAEAQANVARLQALVDYEKVAAPFDGVVTRRYADVGALVQAGTVQAGVSAGGGSMPIVSFAQLNLLRLEFPVPEADVAAVHVGDTVEVNVTSLGKSFEGKVARFAQKVDVSTRTMLTEVDVPNPDYAYTPGMYATVRLSLARQKDALTVPIQSLAAGDPPTVMIVKDNKVERRQVTLGMETPDRAQILSGLEVGDLVVVGSRAAVRSGESATPRLVDSNNS